MAEPEDTKSDEDLTMEEILSSIRKIISEDEEATGDAETEAEAEAETEVEIAEVDEAEAAAEEAPAEPEEVAAEEPAEPEEAAAEEEDVLDLTDVVEEEDEVDFDDDELSDAEEPAPVVEEPEPEIELAAEEEPFPKGDGLLSPDAAQRTSDIIDQLAVTLTSGYEGDGRTLEGLVRAMLKPMLKEWLDVNLPDIVQRSVEAEIARLTRYNK